MLECVSIASRSGITTCVAHLAIHGDPHQHGELALPQLAIGPVLLNVTEREGLVELPLREVRVGDRDGAEPVVLGQVIVVHDVEQASADRGANGSPIGLMTLSSSMVLMAANSLSTSSTLPFRACIRPPVAPLRVHERVLVAGLLPQVHANATPTRRSRKWWNRWNCEPRCIEHARSRRP